MGKDENYPLDKDASDWEFPSGKELGALFRNKREEMGLSYAQISELTKLRPHFLEALENEEWDHLPSPAFVKGFVRSYARVLGLAEDGLVALYQEITPQHHETPWPVLPPVNKRKKLPLYLFLIIACSAAGFAFYTWMEDPTRMGGVIDHEAVAPSDNKLVESRKLQGARKEKAQVPLNEQEPIADLSEPKRAALVEERPPASERDSLEPSGPQPAEEEPIPEKEVSSHESTSSIEPEPTVSNTPLPTETGGQALVLKAIVKERTWIRVTIDDEKTKEYIFGPGSRPEWKAQKVFELLIGNAGGIDLEFNGKKMEDLGKQGQVIRLSLPKEYERSISEN
ncbi:MAG: helix-turn-helix domain-containing protein [Desulfobacteraceae bacterium]|nr:helix-turn-helix domain-containing protein [Desulfobacteraceae bacterium]